MLNCSLQPQSAKFTIIVENQNMQVPDNLRNHVCEHLANSMDIGIDFDCLVRNEERNDIQDLNIDHTSCYIYAWYDNEQEKECWLWIASDIQPASLDGLEEIVPSRHVLLPFYKQELTQEDHDNHYAVTINEGSFQFSGAIPMGPALSQLPLYQRCAYYIMHPESLPDGWVELDIMSLATVSETDPVSSSPSSPRCPGSESDCIPPIYCDSPN